MTQPLKKPPAPGANAVRQFRNGLTTLMQEYGLDHRSASFDVIGFLRPERCGEFRDRFEELYLNRGNQFFGELMPDTEDWHRLEQLFEEHHPGQFVCGDGPDRWDGLALHYASQWRRRALEEEPLSYVVQVVLGCKERGTRYLDGLYRRSFETMRQLCRERAERAAASAFTSSPLERVESTASGADLTDRAGWTSVAATDAATIASSTSMPASIDTPSSEPESDQERRARARRGIVAPVWEERGYRNCDDWVEGKSKKEPKRNPELSTPTARALEYWLSGRTIKPNHNNEAWVRTSIAIKAEDPLP
jgi:hypothetical protein